jgi:DNA-binding LacI/PurR family transcriptional regulator
MGDPIVGEPTTGDGDPAPAKRRRPTLEDVAAQAGVSRALVSIVIRGAPGASAQTRRRVLQVAADLNYRPDTRARLLARSRSRLLGVTLIPYHAFHADLVEGIYAAAEPAGYEVVLSASTPSRSEQRAVETLLDYRCEALVLLAPDSSAAWLEELAERLPVIVIGRRVQAGSVDVVRTADAEGIHQAVNHLVALGHEAVVHIDGGSAPASADRRRGYRSAMRRHGLGKWARTVTGGQSEESGAAAARLLLAEPQLPTAVLAYNDRCATGLLDCLIRAGIAVPRDISVVGFDDSQLSRLSHISLTTVGQDARQLASLAVERAVARLNGEEIAKRELVLEPYLVVRSTTASPLPSGGQFGRDQFGRDQFGRDQFGRDQFGRDQFGGDEIGGDERAGTA